MMIVGALDHFTDVLNNYPKHFKGILTFKKKKSNADSISHSTPPLQNAPQSLPIISRP